MAIKLIFVIILIFAFLIAYSSQAEIKYAQFRDYGDTSGVQYFPIGSKVGIYCVQKTSSKTNITIFDKGTIHIVANSFLQDGFSDTYQFEVINSTISLFTINNLTRQLNDTLFICQSDQQLFATIVGFNPIYDVNPLCSSSYPSRFIFEDSVHSYIEMNCTSEEGDPPVRMSTYIRTGDEVTNISTRTKSSHQHPYKTLSFTSYFNSSFNNSVFVCNVSQQLPALYQSYQGSCSFGPILFLPLFSVAVTPSEIIFSKVKNNSFKCTSDVIEVNLSWTNIPGHWKYDTNEGDAYIELNVTDTGSDVYSVNIQCVGNYRNRNITSTIQISATNNPENSLNHIGKQLLFALANHVLDRVDEIHVIISEVEPDEVKKCFEPEAFSKVVVHDYWANPLGWNVSEDDTLRVSSDEDLFSGIWSTPRASSSSKIAVVVDAISIFLPYQTDSVISTSIWSLLHATKDIPEIQSVCVLGLIHADLHTEKTLNALRHLANVQIRLFTHQTNLVSIR